ncbi:MAG TPA: hypothetical protein PK042_11265, partial [Usitatibacteraceae bacterium]|nr:hypothetical protein [Usitatibacteraceae bacterium]
APVVVLSPAALTLFCSIAPPGTITSSLTISGGSGTFSAGVDHPRVTAIVSGRTVTLERVNGDPALPFAYPTTGRVTVTDGATSASSVLTVPANCP